MKAVTVVCACKPMAEVAAQKLSIRQVAIRGRCTSVVQCQESPLSFSMLDSIRRHTWTKLCAKAMTRTLLRLVLESPRTAARASKIGRGGGLRLIQSVVGHTYISIYREFCQQKEMVVGPNPGVSLNPSRTIVAGTSVQKSTALSPEFLCATKAFNVQHHSRIHKIFL